MVDTNFYLKNGEVLKSIQDLQSEIEKNCNSENLDNFHFHVSDNKNDYANWIRDVFDEKELAELLSHAKTPEDHLDLLKVYNSDLNELLDNLKAEVETDEDTMNDEQGTNIVDEDITNEYNTKVIDDEDAIVDKAVLNDEDIETNEPGEDNNKEFNQEFNQETDKNNNEKSEFDNKDIKQEIDELNALRKKTIDELKALKEKEEEIDKKKAELTKLIEEEKLILQKINSTNTLHSDYNNDNDFVNESDVESENNPEEDFNNDFNNDIVDNHTVESIKDIDLDADIDVSRYSDREHNLLQKITSFKDNLSKSNSIGAKKVYNSLRQEFLDNDFDDFAEEKIKSELESLYYLIKNL